MSGTYVHTGTAGIGIDVVPNLPKCPVPVLMSYRLTEVPGTGIDVVPNLPKFPLPALMYRTYEVAGTGNTGGTLRYVPYQTHP